MTARLTSTLAFALCAFTLWHVADRIITGLALCPIMETCPWH